MVTITFVASVPPATSVPEVDERLTNAGAPFNVADQFNAVPPVFAIFIGGELRPLVPCVIAAPALAESAGVAATATVTPTSCGLPTIALPPLLESRANEPLYREFVANNVVPVTVTVNVALPPEEMGAEVGLTLSQPVPFAIDMFGVMITFPLHVPLADIENVCGGGDCPASVLKFKALVDGIPNVHAGFTCKFTGIRMGDPIA